MGETPRGLLGGERLVNGSRGVMMTPAVARACAHVDGVDGHLRGPGRIHTPWLAQGGAGQRVIADQRSDELGDVVGHQLVDSVTRQRS